MDTAISSLSLAEVGKLFADGTLSPVDVAQQSLARADERRDLNVFVIAAPADEVLASARASEARWRNGEARGPLDGVPYTVKDAIITREWPTLGGSLTVGPKDCLFEDAPAVARMREQGAILLGKTTTPEFGWKAVTDSPLTGVTGNPWNPALTPGGSSGGSAAALAAGIGHVAIGTDAGGSVRIPAAFCGLVGMKATRGRVPAYPFSGLWALTHIGPMTRTVRDASLMLAVMTQPDPRDWNGLPPDPTFQSWDDIETSLKGVRIAYSPTFGYGHVQPDIAAGVEAAVRVFAALGADIDIVEAPFADPTPALRILFACALAHSTRKLSEARRNLMEPALRQFIAYGQSISRTAFMEANETSMMLSREMRLFHRKYAMLLSPTVAVAPFATGTLSPPGYDPDDWLSWSPFTYPFNMSGQPAISVPCGLTSQGLPIGLQLVGPHYSERFLLGAARAFEAANPRAVKLPGA